MKILFFITFYIIKTYLVLTFFLNVQKKETFKLRVYSRLDSMNQY